MPNKRDKVILENKKIIFRNFTGKASPMNAEGNRNFGILLTEDEANAMAKDGWNVKWLKPRELDEGDDGDEFSQPWLGVKLNYRGNRPPRVVLVTSRGRTNLGEEEVDMFDYADIINVDAIINPYEWEVGGKVGVKGYVESVYITIQEDPLELKYALMDEERRRTQESDE